MSNSCEGGAEFFLGLPQLFLVQFISQFDLFPEFDELSYKFRRARVLALCRGVRRYRFPWVYWLALGLLLLLLLLLRARVYLLNINFLLLAIVIRRPDGAS